MKPYNNAFFQLYESIFITLKHDKNEEYALKIISTLMETTLTKSYNQHHKVTPKEFEKIVGKRDENVGLKVSFKHHCPKSFSYIFHTDPFPNLSKIVGSEKMDATYIDFKIKHLLGDNWSYKKTKDLWQGDSFSEYFIYDKTLGL